MSNFFVVIICVFLIFIFLLLIYKKPINRSIKKISFGSLIPAEEEDNPDINKLQKVFGANINKESIKKIIE